MNPERSKIYFVSDAHLGIPINGTHDREQALVDFLASIEGDAEKLFILGDLFEFWFEYRYLMPKGHTELLHQLKKLTSAGADVHYAVGNHDFALGRYLTDEIGVQIHWKPIVMELQGKRVLIAHGDGLNKRDIGYRLLKPILRSRFNQALYRLLPADWGIGLARFCSGASRLAHMKLSDANTVAAYRKIASDLVGKEHDLVVLGHTHCPELTPVSQGHYLNVGGWLREYPFGVLEDSRPRLEYWPARKT